MHHALGANDAAAERLPDRLMAQANAEQRNLAGEAPDQWHRDSRFGGRARAWRNDDVLRTERLDFVERDRIVADDLDRRAELTQVLDQVPGEAVVVVEHQQHNAMIMIYLTVVPGTSFDALEFRCFR